MKRALFVLILLGVACFAAWAGYQWGYTPPPPPEIRTEIVERMVPVEVVREVPVEVPGPERVVERVEWRTREVEVPGETVEIIRQIPVDTPVHARVEVDATKYEGTVDGRLTRGWVGEARCEVRGGDIEWAPIAVEPFDLRLSEAVSTDEPGTLEERLSAWRLETRIGLTSSPGIEGGVTWYRRGRVGWWISGRYDLDPVQEFIPNLEAYRTLDRWEIAGGVAFSWGRK